MRKFMMTAALSSLLMAGTSYAAEPLTDQKMDKVTAGYLVGCTGICGLFTNPILPSLNPLGTYTVYIDGMLEGFIRPSCC